METCKSTQKKGGRPDSVIAAKPKPTANPLAQKFAPYLNGVWVCSDYINDLGKTKSPYASSGYLGGVASFTIVNLGTGNDSLHIGYSLGNHEGADFMLYFKPGHNPTALRTNLEDYDTKSNYYELGYNVKGNDTALFIYHYNKNNVLLDSTGYTRIAYKADDENDAGWGVQYITNQKLMMGKYFGTDSLGNSVSIDFKSDGKISGMQPSTNYAVMTDFEAGTENNLDQLGFYQSEISRAKWYVYLFKADTLNLYSPIKSPNHISLLQGKLQYKLVKQH